MLKGLSCFIFYFSSQQQSVKLSIEWDLNFSSGDSSVKAMDGYMRMIAQFFSCKQWLD